MRDGPGVGHWGLALSLRLTAGLLAGILLLAVWLRFSGLTAQSLWWDEVVSWQQASLPFIEMLSATAEDNYPPLFNWLVQLSMSLFGDTELALRLPSALLGVVNVLALYWVGSLAGGRLAGLLAALLLTLSPFHIWYSGEARMYALLACSATLFAGAILSFATRPRWIMALLTLPCGVTLLYSHPYGALTWAAICIGVAPMLLLRRQPLRLLTLAAIQGLALGAFAPWGKVLADRAATLDAAGFWIAQVTPWILFQMAIQLLSGPFLFAAALVAIRLCFAPPAADPIGDAAPTPRETLAFLLVWAILPMLAGIVLSLAVQPMLISRYLIGSLPALLVLIAIGFLRLPRSRTGYLGLAAMGLAVLIGFFAYGLRPRDDFRGIAAALQDELRPGDCLVMIPEAAIALQYYYREPLPCLATFRTIDDIQVTGKRLVLLDVLDTHLEGIETLGTELSRQSFPPSSLIIIEPK